MRRGGQKDSDYVTKHKALFVAIGTRLKLFNRLRISNYGNIPIS